VTGVIAQLEAAAQRVVGRLSADLSGLGLTPGEVNALAQLRGPEPLAVAELQAATGQRSSTLTGVIDRLERRGLVRRAMNARDRRSFVLELTPAGERAADEVRAAFSALEERVLQRVGPRSLAGFLRVVEAIDDVARQDPPPAARAEMSGGEVARRRRAAGP
jgi:DNA-binding MarR family transcriptional regulator